MLNYFAMKVQQLTHDVHQTSGQAAVFGLIKKMIPLICELDMNYWVEPVAKKLVMVVMGL